MEGCEMKRINFSDLDAETLALSTLNADELLVVALILRRLLKESRMRAREIREAEEDYRPRRENW